MYLLPEREHELLKKYRTLRRYIESAEFGKVLVHLQSLKVQIEDFERDAKTDRLTVSVLNSLAVTYCGLSDFDEAEKLLDQASSMMPFNEETLFFKFITYDLMGSSDKLHQTFTQMQNYYPKRVEYLQIDDTNMLTEQRVFEQLPTELLGTVFSFCGNQDLFNAMLVCKKWRSTILELPLLISGEDGQDVETSKIKSFWRFSGFKSNFSNVEFSELIIDPLNADEDTSAFFINLFKSKIKATKLKCIPINEFIPPMITLSKMFGSTLFQDVKLLSLDDIQKSLAIPQILASYMHLKKLRVFFDDITLFRDNIFKSFPNLELPSLKYLHLDGFFNESLDLFAAGIETPNIETLILENCASANWEKYLHRFSGLKHLKMKLFDEDGCWNFSDWRYSNSVLFPKLEILEICGNLSFHYRMPLLCDSLKSMELKCDTLDGILQHVCHTTEELRLVTFDRFTAIYLKVILDSQPNLKKLTLFQLCPVNMFIDGLSSSNRAYELDYLMLEENEGDHISPAFYEALQSDYLNVKWLGLPYSVYINDLPRIKQLEKRGTKVEFH